MTKAEPFWFHAGKCGIDQKTQQPINSFGQLPDNGRFLGQSYIDKSQAMMAKAWYAYYQNMIDNVETKAEQVLCQTVFLQDASEWPAFEKISKLVFDGHIPPTTIVPVDEIAFYWQYHTPTTQTNKHEVQSVSRS